LRIRSIKPAFWKSETLASIAKEYRLLAIALLNYADDEGYFQAHDALIRGECFPFDEDSTNVRLGLDELSRIGFIEVGTASSGQRIGRVINFLDHQKIDKPSPSKFSAMSVSWDSFGEDSPNPQGAICDPSPLEGKGRERKGTPVGDVELPDWIPADAWKSFEKARKKLRAPLTDEAKTLAIAELGKLRDQGHDPRAVLEQSVFRGWRGLFPLKADSSAKPNANPWDGAH
jgi:hypothetical protein